MLFGNALFRCSAQPLEMLFLALVGLERKRKQHRYVQGVSKNCSTFDKILENKDNMIRLMER